MKQEDMHELVIAVLANAPKEIEKINNCLDTLNVKGKKLGLANLEKMEKRNLLSIRQELKKLKIHSRE